jgi:uncharacterized tellurite resistance protein B-like protein
LALTTSIFNHQLKEKEMRKYPRNSPQAAARIIALTIMADGDVDKAELAVLDELAVHQQLGLEREALHEVIDDFKQYSGTSIRVSLLTP